MKTFQTSIIVTVLFEILQVISIGQPKWAVQHSGSLSQLNSISFFDSVAGITVGSAGTILKTTNGGISWLSLNDISENPFSDIEILNSTNALIVDGYYCLDAACGFIFKTDNRGIGWKRIDGIGDEPAISFHNEMEGIIVGGGWSIAGQPYMGVMRTSDGGETWEHYSNFTLHKIFKDVVIKSPSFVRVLGWNESNSSILRMVINAENWNIQFDTSGILLNSIAFTDTVNGIVVGDHGFITTSSDGGLTWQKQQSNTLANLRSVFSLSSLEAYVAGDGGTILHTTDAGITWMPDSSRTSENLNKIYFRDANHGWAVGNNGTILKYGTFTACNVSNTKLNFGEVNESFSRIMNFSITNTGTLPLIVSDIVSDIAEYTVSPDHATLSVGETQSIAVTFSPLSPGIKTGHLILTHNTGSSPETVLVQGIGIEFGTTDIVLNNRWNLLSNPRIVDDNSVSTLFPTAISSPFRYVQGSGYETATNIFPCEGYWIKFDTSQIVSITGRAHRQDTVVVKTGWNLIGALSSPIHKNTIIQNPPNNIDSDLFGYFNHYVSQDTLTPGFSYWIKVKQDGNLILSSE